MVSSAASTSARLRSICWRLHQCLGTMLFILLTPVAFSGALLTYDHALDRVLNPQRYVVTGSTMALPPSAYLANAAAALEPPMQPSALRFDDGPVTVSARGAASAEGVRLRTVYLDPPTGRVLDVTDPRRSLMGFLHRFHENLTLPDYSGRAIVGWVGVAMLLLSLTGLWLWWPRSGDLTAGLRWRRTSRALTNLHHLVGFWISLPLAVVSLTGIYLSFPSQARALMNTLAPLASQPQRPGFGRVLRQTAMTPDEALVIARKDAPDAVVTALFLPTAVQDQDGPPPSWRIQLRRNSGEVVTLLVNDRTREVSRLSDVSVGDQRPQWIRWIHEGSHSGPVWPFVVLLTGLSPVALSVTGLVMWVRGLWRRRALRSAIPATETNLQAAE